MKVKMYIFIVLLFVGNLFSQSRHLSNDNSEIKILSPDISKPALSLVIDHSLSMRNIFESVKQSSLVLIDLMEVWQKQYPGRLKNLKFQFIEFGGKGDSKTVYKFRDRINFEKLREHIVNSKPKYQNTDYASGLDQVVKGLKNKDYYHKTIMISDAKDEGIGPQGDKKYNVLGDVRFIVVGKPKSGNEKWLGILPSVQENKVKNEFEVMSYFVMSLFEFVDDLNKYLIRRGRYSVDNQHSIKISKHGLTEHTQIVSRLSGEHELFQINDKFNNIVPKNKYKIQKTGTFFQIVFKPNLEPGQYEIVFKGVQPGEKIDYISFERANIIVEVEHLEDSYVESSQISLKYKYWDIDNSKEIKYKDFLKIAAFRQELVSENGKRTLFRKISYDEKEMISTFSINRGYAGNYKVKTSWNYNKQKLEEYNIPLVEVGKFLIIKAQAVVSVYLDLNDCWQGRDLKIKIELKNNLIYNKFEEINLRVNNEIVTCKRFGSGEYKGIINNLEVGEYVLTVDQAENGGFAFAVKEGSVTNFTVKQRYLILRSNELDQEEIINNPISYKNEICIQLPYYDAMDTVMIYDVVMSKLFSDEVLHYDAKITNKNNVLGQDVRIKKNLLSCLVRRKYKPGYTNKYALDHEKIKKEIHLDICKPLGYINQKEAIMPLPSIEFSNISIQKQGAGVYNFPSDQLYAFPIYTPRAKVVFFETACFTIRIILLFVLLIAAILSMIYILRMRINGNRKKTLWREIENQSPQDFIGTFPHKFISSIEAYMEKIDIGINEKLTIKQIMKYLIQNNREKLQHFVVRYCSKEFLEDLNRNKLSQLNLNSEWELNSKTQEAIFMISNINSDSDYAFNDVIRTRCSQADWYGDILMPDESHSYVVQNGGIVCKVNDGGNTIVLEPDKNYEFNNQIVLDYEIFKIEIQPLAKKIYCKIIASI